MTIGILVGWLLATVYVVGGIWGMIFPNTFLGAFSDHILLEWVARGLGLIFLTVGLLLFLAYYGDLEANAKQLGTKNPFSKLFGAWLILCAIFYSGIAHSSHPADPL